MKHLRISVYVHGKPPSQPPPGGGEMPGLTCWGLLPLGGGREGALESPRCVAQCSALHVPIHAAAWADAGACVWTCSALHVLPHPGGLSGGPPWAVIRMRAGTLWHRPSALCVAGCPAWDESPHQHLAAPLTGAVQNVHAPAWSVEPHAVKRIYLRPGVKIGRAHV